jgi:predicted O-methyltransferase YrrM
VREAVQKYSKQMYAVPGWFHYTDVMLLDLVTQAQEAHRFEGDILEIGAFYGRSAILLGMLLGPHERLAVCDLFEAPFAGGAAQEELSRSPTRQPTREEFEHFYRRFHATLPVIHQCASSELPVRLTGCNEFKLIHIDGSHLYEVVEQDIKLARSALTPQGIIVIDDFSSASTAGVAASTWGAVLAAELYPLALTDAKMYATLQPAPEIYRTLSGLIREHPGLAAETLTIAGAAMWYVRDQRSLAQRLSHRALAVPFEIREHLPPAVAQALAART